MNKRRAKSDITQEQFMKVLKKVARKVKPKSKNPKK
jgi:uncharacterized metal-binding protein